MKHPDNDQPVKAEEEIEKMAEDSFLNDAYPEVESGSDYRSGFFFGYKAASSTLSDYKLLVEKMEELIKHEQDHTVFYQPFCSKIEKLYKEITEFKSNLNL